MSILPNALLEELSRAYRGRFGLTPNLINPSGELAGAANGDGEVHCLASIVDARAHALQESIRWGQPYMFFLAPGLVSWMVPLVDEQYVAGGLIGGQVLVDAHGEYRQETIQHLVSTGCSVTAARHFVDPLPFWPQIKTQQAAEFLYESFYRLSGWTPVLLNKHRETALQQQQVAEEVQRRKLQKNHNYPFDQERMLISLIRAGDRKGARKLLNRMLGAALLSSPNLVVVRALMIELLGYLVRTAVEDSTYLEPLMVRNHQWMARILETEEIEDLAVVLREALDDFMERVYRSGYKPPEARVRKALDFLAQNYGRQVSLGEVGEQVGLSTFRIAHLVKEHTGKTVVQHLQRFRVDEAARLLEETSLSCAEIALEVGYTDQSYFTKQFRRLTGITPARHRRLYRA